MRLVPFEKRRYEVDAAQLEELPHESMDLGLPRVTRIEQRFARPSYRQDVEPTPFTLVTNHLLEHDSTLGDEDMSLSHCWVAS